MEPEHLLNPDAQSYFNGDDAGFVMPTWFVPHMMENGGLYGLMLSNGVVLAVERIDRLHRVPGGGLWLDVVLHHRPQYASDRVAPLFYAPPAAGNMASVNCAQIVAAFELGEATEGSVWDGGRMGAGGAVNLGGR